jgi:hypothetical protein
MNHAAKIRAALDRFADFDCYATKDHFLQIFGETIGAHLWGKFTEDYNRDLSKLYCNMDGGNRNKLCAFLATKPVKEG